jgi:hypothetical protein
VNGPNWALRAGAARRHPWNPALGPRAGRRIPGSESWVQASMERAGLRGLWTPGARIDHFVPAAAMTLSYVRYRYRIHARSLMQVHADPRRGAGRKLASAADSLVSLLFDAYPRYATQRLLGRPPERWIRHFRRCQEHLGRLRGFVG